MHKVQDPFDQVYNDDKPSATLEKNRRFRGTKYALQVCHACDAEKSRHCRCIHSSQEGGVTLLSRKHVPSLVLTASSPSRPCQLIFSV